MNITIDRENVAKVGEWVKHKKKMRKVIGYAIGEDERDCYVSTSVDDEYGWRTHLTPMDEVTRKFVEVDMGTDTAVLEKCDGCLYQKDDNWRCVNCKRREGFTDNFVMDKEAGE